MTEAGGVKFDGPNDLAFGPDGRLYFTDSGDWAPDTKPHPGRIVVVEANGEARILEELDHVYPNGIVAESDGSIVWVESYTLKVVRRTPAGRKSVIHTMPEGHIPDGLKIDVEGNLWITAVAAGGVDVIDRNGKPLDFLETGGTILNCAFGKGGALYCCDMGPFDITRRRDDRPAHQGRRRRRRHDAVSRRDRKGHVNHEDRQSRGHSGQLSRAERFQRASPSVPRQDHRGRRTDRLGRVDHAVSRGQFRCEGDHRGHGART